MVCHYVAPYMREHYMYLFPLPLPLPPLPLSLPPLPLSLPFPLPPPPISLPSSPPLSSLHGQLRDLVIWIRNLSATTQVGSSSAYHAAGCVTARLTA